VRGVATAPHTPTVPETTKIPVEGTWFNVKYPHAPCAIISAPLGLIVVDQRGIVSRLEYDPAGFVIATDWRKGGLQGEVETNTIRWEHGAMWVRTPQEPQ
jgi:YD repeat-containing protein